MNRAPRQTRYRSRGFSLLEMLVALLILSFGLLGIAGLQATSLRNNTAAYQRTQANFLAYDMVDRMRANRTAAVDGNYDIALEATPAGTSVAALDLIAWKAQLETALTSGDGSVACDANAICTIVVQWNEVSAGGTQEFLLSTEI